MKSSAVSTVGCFVMCYVFFMSGLVVNFMMLCSMVFWPVNKSLYRRIMCRLNNLHWCNLTFIGQWWAGVDVVLYADPEDMKNFGKEDIIFINNHLYQTDWVIAFLGAQRLGIMANTKVYAKDILKFVPVLGWSWYFTESIFLKRNWEKDLKILNKSLDNLLAYPDDLPVTVLMFPEGTRKTPEKFKIGNDVARQKGYPELKHHLLPRTKGFVHSLKKLRKKCLALIDCTMVYPEDQPEPRLWDMLLGKPSKFYARMRRILTKDIPEGEEESAAWLRELYKEKDDAVQQFIETGTFDRPVQYIPRNYEDLIIWTIWAFVLCVPLLYFIGKIFLLGTFLQQATFIALVLSGALVFNWMVSFSEIHKGSSYGNDSTLPRQKKSS